MASFILVSKMNKSAKISLLFICIALMTAQLTLAQRGDDGSGDDDFDDPGFDDNGYHQPARDSDSSNHNPNSYSPNEGGDLDEDDEPDETHVNARVAQEAKEAEAPSEGETNSQDAERRPDRAELYQHQHQYQHQHHQEHPSAQAGALGYQANQYSGYQQVDPQYQLQQRFYAGQPSGQLLLAGVDPSLGPYVPSPHMRYKRSSSGSSSGSSSNFNSISSPNSDDEAEGEAEGEKDIEDEESSKKLMRSKRSYSKGYIGPVYTYVKTDKHANFKWGVKHKVGKHLG